MANWDEIKQLAADFQRTQTSDTLQKLSERNCIDIVKKLTSLSLIELIYTCDGKEFITPSHLRKEIEDEIYINRGRMQLHDLAGKLNVDFQHVENQAKELAAERPDEYTVILGQIIHTSYKNTLSKLINEYMLTKGQLGIAEFAKVLDLPSEFLCTMVRELMPSVIEDFIVSPDERIYYTAETIDLYRSTVCGTLTAICKPTTIASLIKRLNIPERIVLSCIEALIKEARIDGKVENRLFIPSIYARAQNEWIDKFYLANSYIEYDVVSRMDIKQPKIFLKKKFPEGIQLKSCLISPQLVSQVESLVEEYIASESWIDVTTIVPSVLEPDDIDQILQMVFNDKKQLTASCVVFNKVNVLSHGCIAACKKIFELSLQTRAHEDLDGGKLHEYFLDVKRDDLLEDLRKLEPEDTKKLTERISTDMIPTIKEIRRIRAAQMAKQLEAASQPKPTTGEDETPKEVVEETSKPVDEDKFEDNERSSKKSKRIKEKKLAPVTDAPEGRENRYGKRKQKVNEKGSTSKNDRRKNETADEKEPLSFMSTQEIIQKLQRNYRNDEEFSEELLNDLAETIEPELNRSYEQIAERTLNESLKEDAEKSISKE